MGRAGNEKFRLMGQKLPRLYTNTFKPFITQIPVVILDFTSGEKEIYT